MTQAGVSANKGEPCAVECSLRGEVVVDSVGEDGCYAMVGGNGKQRGQGFAGVPVALSGRCQAVANFYSPAAGLAFESDSADGQPVGCANDLVLAERALLAVLLRGAEEAAHGREVAANG